MDLSRLNTFLLVERFKMETPESIRASLIPGEWVSSIDLSDAYLHIPIHPKLKEIPKVLPQFTGIPVHLPPFRPSHGLTGLYNDCRGIRLHQYLGDWLIRAQSQKEAQVNTQTVVDLTQSLGWILNQEKSKLKPTQVFSFVGYRYTPRFSPCKTHSREMAQLQDLILHLQNKF